MKLRKNNKKGFTIVELVIVIAVIGILTAILVPVFINLTNKANEASDNSLVKNLNTALKMVENDPSAEDEDTHQKLSGKNNSMQDVVLDLKYEGYYLENLVAKSGQDLLWDASKNEFFLSTESTKANVNYWQIVNKVPEFDEQKYSYYAGKNFNATVPNLKYGFDAGYNDGISSLKYVGPDVNPGQTVVIRTNGGTLTIDAVNDTVKHYGDAQVVTLTAVGTDSYYENGSVEQVNIKKGRLVLTNNENTSVETVYLQATGETYDNIILATQSGAELPNLIARDNVAEPSGEDIKKVVTIQTNVNEEGKQPEKVETINLYSTKGESGNDVYEATNGYDVSSLALLVVEASSTAAKKQAAEQISSSEILEKVNEVKSAYEVSNQGDMDDAITNKAKYIKFLGEFTADHLFLVDFNTTIDGCGFKLTSSANRVFRIAGNNREVTFRNLDMISTYSSSDSRVISVDSNYDTMHLTLVNCNLKCNYYALNITGQNGSGTRNLKVDVYDCTIQGYAAINNHASSSMITVNNSTLIGYNGFNAGSSNSFATIVFDGGNYEYEGSYTFGNKIEVNNSTLKQVTLTTNYETVFSSQYGNISSEAHFNNCSIEHEGDNAQYFNYAYNKSSNVKIYIDGELYYEGR